MPVSRGNHVDTESSAPTYRATFNVTTDAAGDAVEVTTDGTKIVKVRAFWFVRPSIEVTLTVVKRSAADTGGTASNATVVPLDSGNPATTVTVKQYTADPTEGTAVGEVWRGVVGTQDSLYEEFGHRTGTPIYLRTTAQTLALNCSAAGNFEGMIEWTEE